MVIFANELTHYCRTLMINEAACLVIILMMGFIWTNLKGKSKLL